MARPGEPHVVVIGAGIAGACVAFGLARRGATVTIVDDELEGRATAAGAGIIQPWGSAASGSFYELYARGAAHYPTLLAQLEELGSADLGFRRSGSLIVGTDIAEIDAVESRLRRRRPDAPLMGDVERLDDAALVERFPPLRRGLHGVWVPGGARVDGRRLVAGVLTAVARLGGAVVAGSVVLTPGPRPTVRVDGSEVGCDAVVVAGGAWSRSLLHPVGVDVDVEPQRGQIVHLQVGGIDTGGWPTVVPVGDHYLVPFDDGRIVVGATRETGSGFDARVTAAGLRSVLDDALTLAPGLAGATVLETRVGLRPLAAGGTPSVGPLAGSDALFVAAGYGAAGLTMAPVLGDALAELVLTGRAPFALPPVPVPAPR